MKLRVFRKDLPLKHVMTTVTGSVSVIHTVIVELEQDGLFGFGECYEDKNVHPLRADDMVEKISRLTHSLKDYALADPVAFSHAMLASLHNDLATFCALEMAACDLWGKLCGRPLRKIWHFRPQGPVITSFTIGQDSIERAIEKFEEAPDWPIYRIEVGGRNDLYLLEEIRNRTDAKLRVDAGGSWSLSQALDWLPALERLGIELIEQPFPADQWEETKIFRKNTSIPIYADESCPTYDMIGRCAGYFDGVNLRPIKFGGLLATKRAVKTAKALGLKTMIGNPIESTIAASAVAQFASELDAIYVDGPLQIDRRVGRGIDFKDGKVVFPHEDGTGAAFFSRVYGYN